MGGTCFASVMCGSRSITYRDEREALAWRVDASLGPDVRDALRLGGAGALRRARLDAARRARDGEARRAVSWAAQARAARLSGRHCPTAQVRARLAVLTARRASLALLASAEASGTV